MKCNNSNVFSFYFFYCKQWTKETDNNIIPESTHQLYEVMIHEHTEQTNVQLAKHQ